MEILSGVFEHCRRFEMICYRDVDAKVMYLLLQVICIMIFDNAQLRHLRIQNS